MLPELLDQLGNFVVRSAEEDHQNDRHGNDCREWTDAQIPFVLNLRKEHVSEYQ